MDKDAHLIFENYFNPGGVFNSKNEDEEKPDYIDADGDGDKKESMKKAVKDRKKEKNGPRIEPENVKEYWKRGKKVSAPKSEDREITKKEPQYKGASKGKDIGKPGKNFAKIAKSASKKYGSKRAGKRVAGAILANMREREETIKEGMKCLKHAYEILKEEYKKYN